MTEEKPRFVADSMFGSLARWLRMMGYDTAYANDMDDDAIVKLALDEKRHIITRDRSLASQPGALMIEADDLDEQLKLVHQRFELALDEDGIRCSACNGELVDLPKKDAEGAVPEGALQSNDRFWRCTSCGKVYWKGTHWLGIMDRLRRLNLV